MLVHIVVCVFLIIVVLLQSGQAADLAGAFGGMGSQTAFGPRGSATMLTKATTLSAVLFMITSMSLSILATRNAGGGAGSTVLDKTTQTAPAVPAVPAKPAQTTAPTPGTPTPVQTLPGTAAPGQPSVTLTPEGGGPGKTVPLKFGPPNSAPANKPAAPAAPKK